MLPGSCRRLPKSRYGRWTVPHTNSSKQPARNDQVHNLCTVKSRVMDELAVLKAAKARQLDNDTNPPGPYRFLNREYMIIDYRTDIDALKRVVPEPLETIDSIVKYEFIRMPDSTGFGDYTESGQVIPVRIRGEVGGYVHFMFLNDHPPVAGGRDLCGFHTQIASNNLLVGCCSLL